MRRDSFLKAREMLSERAYQSSAVINQSGDSSAALVREHAVQLRVRWLRFQ